METELMRTLEVTLVPEIVVVEANNDTNPKLEEPNLTLALKELKDKQAPKIGSSKRKRKGIEGEKSLGSS
jgi:hypothetical protein